MTLENVTRDYIQLLNDAPVDFTFEGVEYTGTRGALTKANNMNEGGFVNDFDLQVATSIKKVDQNDNLVNRFSNGVTPDTGDKITVGGTNYRVERVIYDNLTSIIQFDCMEV